MKSMSLRKRSAQTRIIYSAGFASLSLSLLTFNSCGNVSGSENHADTAVAKITDSVSAVVATPPPAAPVADVASYETALNHMLNGDSSGKWPAKTPMPLEGSILPFKRVIAYYGNLYSKQMGILGELPKNEMFAKLKGEVAKWEKADPNTPVQPALHYIAVTAQGSPGKAGKYRLRMPFNQIDTILKMADEINAIVFLDIQVGLGSLQEEVPELVEYLKKPNVHLGIDPEFSMKGGQKPGAVIGVFDASDINFSIDFMTRLVKENNLPPKILVVHRFTQGMVTNYQNIKPTPEVQVVMHMDGWGEPELKKGTYRNHIFKEPVQFTGFKLFYKNDIKKAPHVLMTPEDLMKLKPLPLYIQYQ
ncbi:hypothetical protein [Pollutibacter soli]|uniref:hypothetical protein n=1 Tax=Pollutibacter soli TaxID=3034157 RepID=UPI0030135BAE